MVTQKEKYLILAKEAKRKWLKALNFWHKQFYSAQDIVHFKKRRGEKITPADKVLVKLHTQAYKDMEKYYALMEKYSKKAGYIHIALRGESY